MRLPVIMLASAFAVCTVVADNRASIVGNITDRAGRPIEHTIVLVYHAGVKKGYSTFCPSCYADCGKRATTDSSGNFVIKGVSADLRFELLAVHEGFQPVFIKKVDPLGTPGARAVLLPRPVATSAAKQVRGRVVDEHGLPLRDVVVEPIGLSVRGHADGRPGKGEASEYGVIDGLEPIGVTDAKGEFEIASQRDAFGMLLKVEARGFAPAMQALATGLDRKTVVVAPGAVVRGRLMHHGTPVASAEIGLIASNRGGFGGKLKIIGNPYEEIRVGTQADGTFVLADVPASVDWYVYPKMESLSKGLAAKPVECVTKQGGQITDIGDLALEAGHRLRGKIVLRGGAAIPDGMRVILSSDHAWDSQIAPLSSTGSFAFTGLATGSYDISPSVRGYSPAEAIRKMVIDKDIDDLQIVLEPDARR